MQLAAVAFARDVLLLKDANTTENDLKTKNPIIHMIPAQKEHVKRRAYGGTMRLGIWKAKLTKDSYTCQIYQKYDKLLGKDLIISERHRHRWEFNNKYAKDFEKAGMNISGRSVLENLVEFMELPKTSHPFYIGTQGHPEYKSRPLKPHPIFLEFIEACRNDK